jgi:Transposase
MFFRTQLRNNPETGKQSIYYRLVENHRNILGEVRQRNILTVGFMENITAEELWSIADGLNARYEGRLLMFPESPIVQEYIDKYWELLIKGKKLDIVRNLRQEEAKRDWQTIDTATLENKDVRELGGEWVCLQTLQKLGIDTFLQKHNFTDQEVKLALSHIVSRAVYPASELKTVSFMRENSSICELTGLIDNMITKDKLYGISKKLFSLKDELENYLSAKTNELFDLQDKIILYDLTNTYFEGEKRNSKKAKRGRSKEKRSDCPLMVLALVVNVQGFIKYSAIYEGNRADCTTLGNMIDKLRLSTSESAKKAIVVIDAGIATEDNLAMIVEKGYDYVCVSRRNLKKYNNIEGKNPVCITDNKKGVIELTEVRAVGKNETEYYLKVKSDGKRLKESSMNQQFKERFEEGLAVIAHGITAKNGTKNYDKVNQRIGRLKAKYPSIHRFYNIHIEKDKKDICKSMNWEQIEAVDVQANENLGVYFIRTSLTGCNEAIVWLIYNCIREIESSFRCLKSDLDLRPIFHKTDEACEAHLHLGLLAYWVVNSIRFQLKAGGINADWREIVRVMSTQKCVTTSMMNNKDELISIRTCSKPTEKVGAIYRILEMKEAPFVRKKSVVHKSELKKNCGVGLQEDTG